MTSALPFRAALSAPSLLVDLFEPWSRVYSDSTLIATLVVFGHVGALLLAGGTAITLDRGTLRAARETESRPRHLVELGVAHRLVVAGLAMSVITGLLLFASDVETYFVSRVFWTKMTLVALLLANGWRMTRAEGTLRLVPADAEPGWRRLRVTALVSLVLWFAIALAGVTLVNAA